MRRGSLRSVPAKAGGAMTEICSPSDKRVLAHFSIDAGIGYIIDQQGSPALNGMVVTPQKDLILRIEDYGDLVHHGFYGTDATGGSKFGFIEVQES